MIASTGAIVFGDEAICPVGDVDRVEGDVLENSSGNRVGKVNDATTDVAPAITDNVGDPDAPPNTGNDGDPPAVGRADGISVRRRLSKTGSPESVVNEFNKSSLSE